MNLKKCIEYIHIGFGLGWGPKLIKRVRDSPDVSQTLVCDRERTVKQPVKKSLLDPITSQGIAFHKKITKQTPWSESASELYRSSDRRLSAK
jgi:hypothetical protein